MTVAHATPARGGADPVAVEAAIWRRTGGYVERHETHGSVVFLAGDSAYKLRKPVRFAFADLTDPAYRRQLAEHDAELAAPLAPGLVRGLLDVVPGEEPGAVDLVPHGAPQALDIVVELARFDPATTLRARLVQGDVDGADAVALGRRLAEFHRAAARVGPVDPRAMVDRNLEEVLPMLDELLPARERFALQRTLDAFLFAWADHLAARAAAGLVIDGHGDLRAEHVLLEPAGIRIVDRLEFDDLRRIDVADELAFLLMELIDLTGSEALGDAVLDGYRASGGVVPPRALLAFFGVHRALVRAKVALLRAEQVSGDAADDATGQAFHLVSVARRLAWRARGRPIVLITGPPASGKSTLATALGEASRVPVLASDDARGPVGTRDYSLQARAEVYRELGERAGQFDTCIVDATFGDEAFQRAFLAALSRERRADLVVLACHAPLGERVARAHERASDPAAASDAGPEVVRNLAQAEGRHPLLPFADRLAVDTQVPLAEQVDLVESWLDSRLAASG